VIVGVDNVEESGRVVRAGVFLAASLRRPLLLVHVRRRVMPVADSYLPVGADLALTDDVTAALDQELADGLRAAGDLDRSEWQLVCTYGDAAAELVRIATDKDAACVVVGHRHSGFGELLHRITSGSVSRAVLASHKFPVLIVP
jgi:nucleotide-binding universal stress UspA family protein